MKKGMIMILVAASLATTITSCKKIRTCCCTINGAELCVDSEEKMTKKDAKKDCEDASNGACKLK